MNCHHCSHKCHPFSVYLVLLFSFFLCIFQSILSSPQPTRNPTCLLDWFVFITHCSHSPSFVNFFQMTVSKTVWIISQWTIYSADLPSFYVLFSSNKFFVLKYSPTIGWHLQVSARVAAVKQEMQQRFQPYPSDKAIVHQLWTKQNQLRCLKDSSQPFFL